MTSESDLEKMRTAWAAARDLASRWRAPAEAVRQRLIESGHSERITDNVLRRLYFKYAKFVHAEGVKWIKTSVLFALPAVLLAMLASLQVWGAWSGEFFIAALCLFGVAAIWIMRGLITLLIGQSFLAKSSGVATRQQDDVIDISQSDINKLESREEKIEEALAQLRVHNKNRQRAYFVWLATLVIGLATVGLGYFSNSSFGAFLREYVIWAVLLGLLAITVFPKMLSSLFHAYYLYVEKTSPFFAVKAERSMAEKNTRPRRLFELPMLETEERAAKTPAEIVAAPLVRDSPISATFVRAGNPVRFTLQEVAAGKTELPAGVLLLTTEGIVFLPKDSPGVAPFNGETISKMYDLAKSQIPLVDLLGKAGLDYFLDYGDDALPDWVYQSLQHHMHFALAWNELSKGRLRDTHEIELTQTTADGTQETFTIMPMKFENRYFLQKLIVARFDHDLRALTYRTFLKSKFEETFGALRKKFADIYGDRVEEYEDQILEESKTRIRTWKAGLDDNIDEKWQAQLKEQWPDLFDAYRLLPFLTQERPMLIDQ